MGDRCYSMREIGEILELDADDPRRRHVDACPRCTELATQYRKYLDEGGEYPGPSLVEAQQRIRDVIDGNDPPGVALPDGKRRRRDGILDRVGRPVLITAAVLIVAWGITLVCDRKPPPRDLFETIARPQFDEDDPLAPHHAVPLAKSIRLSWNSAPGAATYTLIIFDDVMNEVRRVEHLRSTEVELERDDIPGKSKGKTYMWRVEMHTEAGETGLSPVATFTMP